MGEKILMRLLNNELRKFNALKRKFKNKDGKKPAKTDVKSDLVYDEGLSIITPSHNGEKYISKLLSSIENQTLSNDLFELIIVINGEPYNTTDIVEKFREHNPSINLKIIHSDIANASNARNIAIVNASKKYSTFIDDDDYISSNYLESMYKNAAEDRIVISRIKEIDEQGNELHSFIDKQLDNLHGIVKDPYREIHTLISLNSCKLIPTSKLNQIKFRTNLESGEDIVFFSELIVANDLEFYVLSEEEKAVYYRLVRFNSVSRKDLSYEFNVTERMNVINELNHLLPSTDDINKQEYIKLKIRSQTLFINRYLHKHPDDHHKIAELIQNLNLNYFPYNILNKNLAKKLVISYCFPPYVDTSANVMSKRIRKQDIVVDVILNRMDEIRDVDENLNCLTEDLIENKIIINSHPSFKNWKHIEDFCVKGIQKIDQIVKLKGEYEEIYSRSMFPASHFLAFEYKIKYPNVKWTAEFSDPLIFDIKGNLRNSKLNNQKFMDKINGLLTSKKVPLCEDGNLFVLCEYLPYIFADELIFTNENQKEYMMNKFPYPEIKSIIEQKSRIDPHPSLKKDFYNLKENNYHLNNNYVNIAYFGAFYATRNLDEVFHAIYRLNNAYKNKCKVHFFTNDVEGFKTSMECSPIYNNLIINPYVSFLEFLNLTTKFDCLIVNDAHTEEYKKINPYLPSKLSDYLGSGTDIWGIYEENSTLSKTELKYKSPLDDINSSIKILKRIIDDHC